MTKPLMPKATASWLVDNTSLTFEQIADFTGLHVFEIQVIADGAGGVGVQGLDPVTNGQLSKEEIARCEADKTASLQIQVSDVPRARHKVPRYTPLSRRADKPDAIAWLLKQYPSMTDMQIIRLVGTTKNTIGAIRDRSHWNMPNLRPRNPVELSFCSYSDLQAEIDKLSSEVSVANGEAI